MAAAKHAIRLASVGAAASVAGLFQVYRTRVAPLPDAHPAVDSYAHFIPRLREFVFEGQGLPTFSKLTAESFKPASIAAWYQSTEPLQSGLGASFWISVVAWLLAEITGNASQIDRVWTFLPVIFSAHFTLYPYLVGGATSTAFAASNKLSQPDVPGVSNSIDKRMLLILVLQCCWSLRLSYNTFRRGLFSIWDEDYRWPILRQRMSKIQFKLLNFFFIAFTQTYLLYATALPQYLLLTMSRVYHPTQTAVPLGIPDAIIAGTYLLTLAVEMTADNQQQAYQKFKRAPADPAKDKNKTDIQLATEEASRKRGFVTSGLWAYSRHPNFACEQFTWWVLYAFTLRATIPGHIVKTFWSTFVSAVQARDVHALRAVGLAARPYLVNYSIAGPVSYSLLFIASTIFSEGISSAKYPLYRSYQSAVPMFWPIEGLLIKTPLNILLGRKKQLNHEVFGHAGVPARLSKGAKKQ